MSETNTVILVHGLWTHPLIMRPIGRYLISQGFAVKYFGYPSVRHSLEQNTKSLADFIEQMEDKPVYLLGHSLGGIICLNYLQQDQFSNIKRCVLLGSPINSSVAAKSLNNSWWGRIMLGKSSAALVRKHNYPDDPRIGFIIGNGSMGLGRLFADIPMPHDGAVAVEEALPKKDAQYMQFKTSHSSMLFSKPIAKAVKNFLLNQKF